MLYLNDEDSSAIDTIFREPGPDSQVMIMIRDTYFNDWKFYQIAIDSDGLKLDFKPIDSDVSYCYRRRCTYNETFVITVPQYYLEKKEVV